MGQAKNRGSFEQRQAEGIAKQKLKDIERVRRVLKFDERRKARKTMNALVCIALGFDENRQQRKTK